jgi:hypothetical protein
VVGADDAEPSPCKERDALEDLGADDGCSARAAARARTAGRFVQDRVGHGDLADVVEQEAVLELGSSEQFEVDRARISSAYRCTLIACVPMRLSFASSASASAPVVCWYTCWSRRGWRRSTSSSWLRSRA